MSRPDLVEYKIVRMLLATQFVVGAQPMTDEMTVQMVRLLAGYPIGSLQIAFERCCAELHTSRLTIRDITSRLDPVAPAHQREGAALLAAAERSLRPDSNHTRQ